MVAPLIPLIAGIAIRHVAKKIIKRKAKSLANLKNKRQGKMKKEIDKGVNPFPMRVDTRHGGASNVGRSSEGVTKHLLRSVKKAKTDFQKGYKVKTKNFRTPHIQKTQKKNMSDFRVPHIQKTKTTK